MSEGTTKNSKKFIFIGVIALVIIGVVVFLIVNQSSSVNVQQLEADLREQELLSTGMYASLLLDKNAGSYISQWESLLSDVEETKNNRGDKDYAKKLQDLIARYEKLRTETKKYLGE